MRRLLVLCALATAACGTTQFARPLGRGTTRFTASLGGPLVRFGGAPVPLPITTVGVAHGLSDLVDVGGDLHPTAMAFGVAGASAHVAVHPLTAHRSALTVGGSVSGFGNAHDGVLFTDLWLAGGGRVAPWLWLGGGVHNGLRVVGSSSLSEQTPWTPTLAALASFLPSSRVALNLELRWYAFTTCGRCATPDYYSLGDAGGLGVLLGLDFELPGGAR